MLNPWYVTGFCEGAAVFTYSKSATALNLSFSIKQKQENLELIQKLREFFGSVGVVYPGAPAEINRPGGLNYFRVTRNSELQVIIRHFDKYSFSSKTKQRVYQIWREMVIYKNGHFRKIDYSHLESLAEKLSAANSLRN